LPDPGGGFPVPLPGPQVFACIPFASTPALSPQTLIPGLPAFTGTETVELPPLPPFPLVCEAGAQALLCVPLPSTLPLMPQTSIPGLPALTGAEITLDPAGEPPLLLCAAGAQVFA
jgi:hypothetical protein